MDNQDHDLGGYWFVLTLLMAAVGINQMILALHEYLSTH